VFEPPRALRLDCNVSSRNLVETAHTIPPFDNTIVITNRRREVRSPMREAFANTFIDGRPYTVEVIDASPSGFAIQRAPNTARRA